MIVFKGKINLQTTLPKDLIRSSKFHLNVNNYLINNLL